MSTLKCTICEREFSPSTLVPYNNPNAKVVESQDQIYCSKECRRNAYSRKGMPKYEANLKRIVAYHRAHPEKVREWNMRARAKSKHEALAVYGGPICVCCGETNMAFLTLDHINGGGGEHRRQIASGKYWKGVAGTQGVGGASFYAWLTRENYPDLALQVLCANCQLGKRALGINGNQDGRCPHESNERIPALVAEIVK